MTKSNLEPIEDGDLDLEGKLKNGGGGVEFVRKEEAPVFAVEKEVPQEISAAEKDAAYGNILAKVQADDVANEPANADVANDAKLASQKTDAETQISHLIDIAQQKGVFHAVKVARHMEDNYVLDTFHDRMLADELHDALVKKGMIKEL